MTSSRVVAAGVLAIAVMRPCVGADEPTLLDETASGVVPVASETTLRVRGIEGQVYVRRGEAGEVEFRNTSLDAEDAEVPIALWSDGETFRLEPPQGKTTIRARLSVSVPPQMRVRLELERAAVTVSELDGDLVVSGRQVQLDAQVLLRPVQIEIEGGTVSVQGASRGVTIRGRELAVLLDRIAGRTELRLNGGSAKLMGLQSGLQGDFTGTSVSIDTVTDSVSLKFLKGKARLARLRDGGDIVLTDCPLVLEEVAGDVSITSDSSVGFNNCRASLHIENTAGPVTGVKSDGRFEITTHNSQVALGQIQGQLRIAGDGLDVKLEQIGATVSVAARNSSVAVDMVTAAVNVESDGGDVRISRAEAQVDLTTRGGNVQLQHLRGPISVQADSPMVDVEWDVLTSAADSRITNDGGDITVRFPPAGDSRVEVTSRSGRIENNLSKVVVHEDGGSAQGVVGGGGSGLNKILIQAAGDVKLLGPETEETAEPSGEAP